MSTICADELLYEPGNLREDRRARATPARHRAATTARSGSGPAPATATRRRFEDFEARASHLGDLLGGQVFPRAF